MKSYGGFDPKNIQKSIVNDCFASGDPVNYWKTLFEVISTMDFSMQGNRFILIALEDYAKEFNLLSEE